MSRIRSLNVTYGILLVALSSLAVAACGGGGSTKRALDSADTVRQQRVREFNRGKKDVEHWDRRARHEYAHEGV